MGLVGEVLRADHSPDLWSLPELYFDSKHDSYFHDYRSLVCETKMKKVVITHPLAKSVMF